MTLPPDLRDLYEQHDDQAVELHLAACKHTGQWGRAKMAHGDARTTRSASSPCRSLPALWDLRRSTPTRGSRTSSASTLPTARAQCPVLRDKRISPHTLRHTCALNILQATGDIRKVSLWLGHAQQSTTEIYLHIDPTEKIAALESSVPVRLRPGRFQPADRLLASLMPSKTPSPPAPG